MDHCVPHFDVEDPRAARGPSKAFSEGDGYIKELIWEDGHAVTQSHQSLRKSAPTSKAENAAIPASQSPPSGEQSSLEEYHHLFMQGDEMTAPWLQYPLNDGDADTSFNGVDLWNSDLLSTDLKGPGRDHGFGEAVSSYAYKGPDESMRVDPHAYEVIYDADNTAIRAVMPTSPSGSSRTGGVAELPPRQQQQRQDNKKRKGREETEDRERHYDRIKEKMKALHEVIPWYKKVDKASMLDEAVGYIKSLQMQVQVMSMGCGMVPLMLPCMNKDRTMLFPVPSNILGGCGGGGPRPGGDSGSVHLVPAYIMSSAHCSQPILVSNPSGLGTTMTAPTGELNADARMSKHNH